jgi:tetratricopeptide (TPR) repeat protein
MNRSVGFRTDAARRRRLLVCVAGILTLAGLAGGIAWRLFGPGAEPEGGQLQAAEEAMGRHDPAAARAHLDAFLAGRPKDRRALLLAIRAARGCDACADAERLLAAYEDAAGPTDDSRFEWLLLGVQQGDFGGAEDRLLRAVARHQPQTPAILEALAKGYSAARRKPDAVTALSQLLEQDPDHVGALLMCADILDSLRQSDAAEKDLRRAVDRAPDSAAAHAALAGLLERQGHTHEAIDHYQTSLRLRPADPAALLGLARAFCDDADLAGARQQLDELLASRPDHPDGLVERARLALRQGKPAEAEPLLERATRAAPWHRDAQQFYLGVLMELGRTEAAARCAERVARLRDEDAAVGRLKLRARDNPGDPDNRWELWQWSLRNGQAAEGLSWLLRILMTDPHDARANAALAGYFERAGQPRRAAGHRAAAARQARDREGA